MGVVACGDDDSGGGGGGGGSSEGGSGSLTVYSSLPLQGASRPQTTALVSGIELALKEAGGKAGDITVNYESLDDSTAQAGSWTPEATSANARRAAQDDSTGVYIGEFNSGASAVSMPILNEANIPQISPANTAVGLTSDDPGADTDAGEPDIYFPTGNRHYVRIVPKDTIQGAALATVMEQDGCTKIAMLNDREVYGAGLNRNVKSSAEALGLEVVQDEGIDKAAANYRSLASAADEADCMVYSGITANNAVQLYKDYAAALPDAKLYGPDGVAESGFSDPKEGGIPADVASRVKVTVATLSPDEYGEAGKKFFEDFEAEYNEPNPDPYAIYGYEAMSLALDAIERAGSTDRQAIIDALFDTQDRDSVLGTYSIDENGDTTLTDYGVYTIEGGELTFDQTVQAEAATE